MRDPYTRKCVNDSCPNNTFYDINTDQCVQNCPTQNSTGIPYYGDTNYPLPKCVIDTDCTNGTYADDQVGLCVNACSYNQWKYGKRCLAYCPDGYYGNFASGFCVQPLGCPTDHYAQNYTKTCVAQCNGTFAYVSLKVCVSICPTGLYADSVTRLCSVNCTNNASISLHRDQTNRTCVSSCS